MARPSTYTAEMGNKICERIAEGQSLQRICRDEDMPDRQRVLAWLRANNAFRAHYASARDEQTDSFLDLANSKLEGAYDKDSATMAKALAEGYVRIAEKQSPKKYGNKLELSGSLEMKMTDEQLESRLAQLLGKDGAGTAPGGAGETEETP